jgi:pimeloyl-ACP methyl ester carboxylesterase/DNA-binding CsgD family transcriptional regulator
MPAMVWQVNYARAADAVRIAWVASGGGDLTPLVAMRPPQFSHLQREREMPFSHHEYDAFCDERMVLRFDPRGTGMSDRDAKDQSLEARLLDIEAVLSAAGIERVILDAISSSALTAIAFAARYPERVERLIVQNAFADGRAWWDERNRQALVAITEIEWTVCTETWAWMTWASADTAVNLRLAEHIRECISPGDFRRSVEAERAIDLRPLLPRLRMPTLVLSHPHFTRMVPTGVVSDLAAAIPGARLVRIGSTRERVRAISDFLHGREVTDRASNDEPVISQPAQLLSPDFAQRLSGREIEVLRLLVLGKTNREIAAALVVGVRTVDTHVAHIYEKTGTNSRAAVTAFGIRNRLLQDS